MWCRDVLQAGEFDNGTDDRADFQPAAGQVILQHRGAYRTACRHLVGPRQSWVFTPPPRGYVPPALARTSIYVHVPFCRNDCPYCPYIKVPYSPELVPPFERAALAEIDWWAARGVSTIVS